MYDIFPAVKFPDHPEWPEYEAPARWFIDPTFSKDED